MHWDSLGTGSIGTDEWRIRWPGTSRLWDLMVDGTWEAKKPLKGDLDALATTRCRVIGREKWQTSGCLILRTWHSWEPGAG